MSLLLAIDQGTTGTKSVVVDETLKVIASSYKEFPQHFPQPGYVEHDLEELWASVIATLSAVATQVDTKKLVALGITNQRETLCFWEKNTLRPLCRAIVWQDRRTSDRCAALTAQGKASFITEHTGLLLDPYFSGTKLWWALQHNEEVQNAYKRGTLAIGTVDSYLVARLTQGRSYATEPSNASRTLCFHLTNHTWDAALAEMLEVPADLWPEVRSSLGEFGKVRGVEVLPDGLPITGILGDQQAALLGQACLSEGTVKCTYGTGSFLLLNTGKTPVRSSHNLLTTIAWMESNGACTYALEGSAFVAGAAVQWLRDGLGIISSAEEVEALAKEVSDTGGVTFVPAFTGLGAPYWDSSARGMLSGLTRGTTRAHLARAVLEGVAFQNADLIRAMKKDLRSEIHEVKVDGGMSRNNLLMQLQADILNIPLVRPQFSETTVLGAVFAAGLGAGVWDSLERIRTVGKEERRFVPLLSSKERENNERRWEREIQRVRMKEE